MIGKRFAPYFMFLRTGIQWKALSNCLVAASTVHDRFQMWVRAGVFEKLWRSGLLFFDQHKGLCWSFQALDGAITKAPLGGEATGLNPTDRAKRGTKRSRLVEGNGVPIGLVVDGANVHDGVLAQDTLVGVVAKRPKREGFELWDFKGR
jgi:putative transposase